MNLDELRSVQSKERQKDSLQNLRPSFYREVGDYIADLEAERDRVAEQADDPFSSPEVSRLTDEIETAKDVVEAIYERRMGKLVKQASLAAAGMAANDEGLTAEEADLFDDLVDRIGSNKSRVLDVLEGVEDDTGAIEGTDSTAASGAGPTTGTASGAGDPDGVADPARTDANPSPPDTDPPAEDPIDGSSGTDEADRATGGAADDTPPVPPQEPPADADPPSSGDGTAAGPDSADSSGVTPADVMGGDGPAVGDDGADPDPTPAPTDADAAGDADTDPGASSDDATDLDRVTVRITRDVGAILGVDDREYALSTDDIVTLPEQNATPLLEGDAAEPLE